MRSSTQSLAGRQARRRSLQGLGLMALALVLPGVSAVAATPGGSPGKGNTEAGAGLVRLPDGRFMAPDIARIIQRGELVVAMYGSDNFPFFYTAKGTLVGHDVQMMQGLARSLGVALRFDRSSKTFDGVVDLVAQGQADLAVGRLARTITRAQRVQFSNTYMKLDHALLIHRLKFAELARERSPGATVREFSGSLAVIQGSAWEEFARLYFPKATIVGFPNWNATVDAVKKGKVVAAYRDEYEVRSLLRQDPSLALTLRTVTFDDLQSHWAVMVGLRDAALLNIVNEYLAQRTEKTTIKDVLKEVK